MLYVLALKLSRYLDWSMRILTINSAFHPNEWVHQTAYQSFKAFLHCPSIVQSYLPGGTSEHSQLIHMIRWSRTSLPVKRHLNKFSYSLSTNSRLYSPNACISSFLRYPFWSQKAISGTAGHCNTMPMISFHWKDHLQVLDIIAYRQRLYTVTHLPTAKVTRYQNTISSTSGHLSRMVMLAFHSQGMTSC